MLPLMVGHAKEAFKDVDLSPRGMAERRAHTVFRVLKENGALLPYCASEEKLWERSGKDFVSRCSMSYRAQFSASPATCGLFLFL